jgi:hypothetical protein
MKRHFAIAVCAALTWHTALTAAEPVPKIEQGIYKPVPPFENIKQAIYVRERERPLLPLIEDASTSIAVFLLDMFAYGSGIRADVRFVLPEARDRLRLPPPASASGTANAQGRFIDSAVYCWRSDNPDQLRFLIEWADPTTKARYTDSYVFVRRGATWYFEKHDTIAPWTWTQTRRYFQRSCPDET